MAWLRAGFTEVTRRRHNALSEHVLPNTVHHHARQQRILPRCYPLGKTCPSGGAGGFRIKLQIARQQFRCGWHHLSPQCFRAAPVHHARHNRLHKPPDKARARRLFLVLADVRLNRLQRRRSHSAFLVNLLDEMRVGQRAPLSVNALPFNLHVAEG